MTIYEGPDPKRPAPPKKAAPVKPVEPAEPKGED